MKCPSCSQENRTSVRHCRKCGRDLALPPVWFPDWRWHLRALSWIFLTLIVLFFAVSHLLHRLPPPHDQRDIPKEMTPWLNPHKIPPP